MLPTLKKRFRSIASAAGYEIQPVSVYTSPGLRYRHLFSLFHIDLIVDVGANAGHFALKCRASGYKGEIISFEPSHDPHRLLLASAAKDPLWTVADRMALGAVTGEAEINISANSLSSSLLPMLNSHLAAAPKSIYIQKEKVSLQRLDDVLPKTSRERKIFLKLDVQGYEPQVLAGAANVLDQTLVVQLEMSLLPLYKGEVLISDMCADMNAKGFELWDLDPSFRDSATGRLLQVDGIFTGSSQSTGDTSQ